MKQQVYEEALKAIVRRIENAVITDKTLLLRDVEEIAREALRK